MYHIKNNGKLLCGYKPKKHEKIEVIPFLGVNPQSKLLQCCNTCRNEFISILNHLKEIKPETNEP